MALRKNFARALKEVKNDPSTIPVWQSIIGRYGPAFLSLCENAIAWSKAFVEYQLETVMFDGEPDARTKAKRIVRKLTDYRGNKSHQRHIHYDELHAMRLKLTRLVPGPPGQVPPYDPLGAEPNGLTNFKGQVVMGYTSGPATDNKGKQYVVITDIRVYKGTYRGGKAADSVNTAGATVSDTDSGIFVEI